MIHALWVCVCAYASVCIKPGLWHLCDSGYDACTHKYTNRDMHVQLCLITFHFPTPYFRLLYLRTVGYITRLESWAYQLDSLRSCYIAANDRIVMCSLPIVQTAHSLGVYVTAVLPAAFYSPLWICQWTPNNNINRTPHRQLQISIYHYHNGPTYQNVD